MVINDTNSELLWSTNIPPSATLWTHLSRNIWKFSDPATTYGVRKAKVVGFPGGDIITYMKGRNTNIFGPVTPAVSRAYVRVEIFDGTVTGVCYDGTSGLCTGAGNTQLCKLP